jgi:hypothetical protein
VDTALAAIVRERHVALSAPHFLTIVPGVGVDAVRRVQTSDLCKVIDAGSVERLRIRRRARMTHQD